MHSYCSKYQVGSSVLLANCNDIDYLYVYERESDYQKAKKFTKKEKGIDNHYATIEMEQGLFYNSYAKPYTKLLEGKELIYDSIYDHEKEYAQLLLNYSKKLFSLEDKRWYHLYLGYWALKNGKDKKFSQAQLDKAQEIHDKGISKTLKQNIFDYLTNLVNN